MHLQVVASIPLAAYGAVLSMPVLTMGNVPTPNTCVAEHTGSSSTQSLEIARVTAPKALVKFEIRIWIHLGVFPPSFSAKSK